MKTIAKHALFAAKDLNYTDVPLPDEYGKGFGLRVRKLTGHERAELQKKYLDGGRAEKDPEGFMWHMILWSVVSEDDSPYFAEKDRAAFMAKSGELAKLLFETAANLNNLGEASVGATVKN